MKRLLLGLLALGVFGASELLAADVTTQAKRSSTNKIEIYGDLGLKAAFREDFFDALFARRNPDLPGTWRADHDEIFGVPCLSLFLEAKLKDNLGAVLRMGLAPGYYGMEAPVLGMKNSTAYFEELYVYGREFLGQYTNVYIGEKNVRVDLRENGDEFFCNILQSENPFTGAVHTDPALTGIPDPVSGVWSPAMPGSTTYPFTPLAYPYGSSPGGMFWNGYLGGNAWWNNYAKQASHSTFAGAQVEWVTSREKTGLEPFRMDFAIGKVLETQMANTDTLFFMARPLVTLDLTNTHKHWSRLQIIAALLMPDKDIGMGALGFGASIRPHPAVELFAEYIGEFGEYTSAQRNPGKDKVHQESHAAYAGFRLEPEIKVAKDTAVIPFGEFSFWFVGGDRGDPYANENNDFISMEDVDTFLIMEDNDFGLDVDCNYRAFKGEVGVRFETMELSVRYGVFHVLYAPNQTAYGAPPFGGKSFSRELGNEVDLRFTLKLQECVKINLVAAFLFDAFFWDETVRARGLRPNPWESTGTDAAMGLAELLLEF